MALNPDEFTTYIFHKSSKKQRKKLLKNTGLAVAIVGVLYITFVGYKGLSLGIIGAIGLITGIIGAKLYDDKFMGITAYGDRGKQFVITETGFRLGDAVLPFAELKDLVIYVDEYAGMRKNLVSLHHGGNNEIRFTHNGQPIQLFYIIKNRADLQRVELLVEKIERAYPVK